MNDILEKQVAQKIERFEAFEERLNVTFDNISVRVKSDDYLVIYLEVHPRNGNKLKSSVSVECVIYNASGSIIEREMNYLDSDSFFGFEVIEFSFSTEHLASQIAKVRIYPKE
jgi:hypothetical protein